MENKEKPDAKSVGLNELLAVYDKYKHLDSVFMLNAKLNSERKVDDEHDPFHIAAMDFWVAIKNTLKRQHLLSRTTPYITKGINFENC